MLPGGVATREGNRVLHRVRNASLNDQGFANQLTALAAKTERGAGKGGDNRDRTVQGVTPVRHVETHVVVHGAVRFEPAR